MQKLVEDFAPFLPTPGTIWAKAESRIRIQAAFRKDAERKKSIRSFGTAPFEQQYGIGMNPGPSAFDLSKSLEAQANKYARLKLKFERASWLPWLPLEPD